jgi:ribosomal protein L25 (general stress protein Ctc)
MYTATLINWNQKGGLRKGSSQQNFYAQLSSVAYAKDRKAKLKDYMLNGWKLDPASNPDMGILYNPKTKEIVYSIRGTNTSNIRDLGEDALITAGLSRFSPRAKRLTKLIKKTNANFDGYDKVVTGHSLGANLAKTISDKTKIPAVVFNRGSSPVNNNPVTKLWNKIFKKESQTTNYSVPGDVISVSARKFGDEKQVEVKAKPDKSEHSIDNFIDGAGKGLRAKALALGATEFGNSTAKSKRFYVIYQGKKINFGLKGGQTFIDHKDKAKRKAWLARHRMVKLKTGRLAHLDKRQASYWAKVILW